MTTSLMAVPTIPNLWDSPHGFSRKVYVYKGIEYVMVTCLTGWIKYKALALPLSGPDPLRWRRRFTDQQYKLYIFSPEKLGRLN